MRAVISVRGTQWCSVNGERPTDGHVCVWGLGAPLRVPRSLSVSIWALWSQAFLGFINPGSERVKQESPRARRGVGARTCLLGRRVCQRGHFPGKPAQ